MMVAESETDLLISVAREYEKLLDKEIKMVLGRKGKSEIKMTLLQTKLINSGTEIVIFQSPSYKDE
ncbi:hypothetical protein [Lactobacillus sp. ESL0677]|uniref:hypothetical protein n=1 Tax=Lactobacillus sp. ESL0677 TaxID=2983208 RepID=UPI0023F68A58|nr:hypothetical protein [Lactobacillus sp. ESL0677]WEV37297.1 hypothetical protein OZX76_01560 [Lactobacillus sp. ESL0677]